MTDSSDIAERFAALAPWRTRIAVGGGVFGGEVDYSADQRVPTFFRWVGSPRTILELGSLEGAHTLQLAAPETTERVLGVEGREDNVARARLLAELLGARNVEFAREDPATVDLSRYGRFDAVFCAGLLHRLAAPWRLLGAVARIADRLFLDTRYWPGPRSVEVDGYRGGWLEESDGDELARGVNTRSFCLTRPSLMKALTDTGWAVRHVADQSRNRSRPRIWLGCERPARFDAS